MSNEALHTPLPRTKIQFHGFRGPSRAIRKIHIVAWRGIFVSPWRMKVARLHPSSVHDSVLPFHLLPSDLLTSPSFQRAKLQIFAFHSPKIWLPRMKQYCLTCQTQVFDAWNNIVWALECKDFENQTYSFLNSEAFSGVFIYTSSHLLPGLTEMRKIRVSRKGHLTQICQANGSERHLFDFRHRKQGRATPGTGSTGRPHPIASAEPTAPHCLFQPRKAKMKR